MNAAAVSVLRRSLWPFGFVYASIASLRNLCYRTGLLSTHRLPVPVVSVGNLTVGGTGKTPLVLWLVEQARARGLRPGVLARGYGRPRGAALNDEGMLLAARAPDLPQVQDPDRVRGGHRLVEEHRVDLVILDDGFQHRRLHRDRDLVCLDALRPFAQNRVLPAGDLREPRSGIRRADAIVLTRADQVDAEGLASRRARLAEIAGRDLPIFEAEHQPLDVVVRPGGEVLEPAALSGRRVHLLSAIARPDSFERTAAGLGANVVVHHSFRDHHRYRRAELQRCLNAARADRAELLTTEKDAVKLSVMPDVPYLTLRLALCFRGRVPDANEVGLV